MNVVFDFGAVLFEWRPAERVARHFPGLAGTPALARTLAVAIFHHADWQDFDRGLVTLAQVVESTAVRLSLARHEVHELLAPIGEQLQPIRSSVVVLESLARRRALRGDVRLYFLSNMPEPFARALERRHAFLELFDGGVFSGDVKLGKPDAAIYQLLADRHGLAPERTLFIDDMAVNVTAAQAQGWSGIHLSQPEQLADQIQRHLAERRALGV
jgi:putative hydrolase of the HAD superfamily